MTIGLNSNFVGSWNISVFRQRHQGYLFVAPLKQPALIFVLVLFGIDAFFIGAHALSLALKFFGFQEAGSSLKHFKVSHDGGIPEIFNYFMLCLTSAVLVLIYRRSRTPMYLILALIFVYAFLDDAFTLHEQLSLDLAEALAFPDMWRRSAFAQALYFAIVAGVSVPMLLAGWINANSTHRRLSATMIASLCALAFFAAFVDLVHELVGYHSRIVYSALDLIEDGGEMLIVTLSCWVALSIHNYVAMSDIDYGSSELDQSSAEGAAIN